VNSSATPQRTAEWEEARSENRSWIKNKIVGSPACWVVPPSWRGNPGEGEVTRTGKAGSRELGELEQGPGWVWVFRLLCCCYIIHIQTPSYVRMAILNSGILGRRILSFSLFIILFPRCTLANPCLFLFVFSKEFWRWYNSHMSSSASGGFVVVDAIVLVRYLSGCHPVVTYFKCSIRCTMWVCGP
jgi:hypothetical protein